MVSTINDKLKYKQVFGLQMIISLFIALSIFLFWFSLGLTEGWHWRKNHNILDNNKLINDKNYHVWRLFTNAAILLVPIFVVINPVSIWFIICANIFSWMCYERSMGYAELDKWFIQRPPFRLLGKEYNRPSMVIQNIILVFSFIATIILLFI